MRTTIDLPDALFRKTKARAALQGTTIKALIVRALEREASDQTTSKPKRKQETALPVIKSWKGPKLDLSNFDFDDLLV
ncbi:MAG: hypothetical protein JO062_24385 [Bryobacterales bacterium]|nr:hypothetical protein [Bryobacterales bacterium]